MKLALLLDKCYHLDGLFPWSLFSPVSGASSGISTAHTSVCVMVVDIFPSAGLAARVLLAFVCH